MNRRSTFHLVLFVFTVLCSSRTLAAQEEVPALPFSRYPNSALRAALFAHITLSDSETKAAFAQTTAFTERTRILGQGLATATPDARNTKIAEWGKQHADDLRKILTPRQRVIFDSNYKAWTKERAEHPIVPPRAQKPPADR